MRLSTFESYRPYLFSIAYQMLGSVMDAEDVLQEAYLRCQPLDEASIEHPRAYLATVVSRLSLNHLSRAAEKRQTYIGPWLPEPLISSAVTGSASRTSSPGEHLVRSEALSMAFLVLLEQLSPAERAVFLLREVFEYEYAEIAEMLDKSEVACRQLFSRAKKHITSHRPRFESSPAQHQRLLESFLQAVQAGQVDQLAALLAEDVTAWTDGGGKVFAARSPLIGRELVARFLLNARQFAPDATTVLVRPVNGKPAILMRDGSSHVFLVISLDVNRGAIQTLHLIANPDKLGHLSQAM